MQECAHAVSQELRGFRFISSYTGTYTKVVGGVSLDKRRVVEYGDNNYMKKIVCVCQPSKWDEEIPRQKSVQDSCGVHAKPRQTHALRLYH